MHCSSTKNSLLISFFALATSQDFIHSLHSQVQNMDMVSYTQNFVLTKIYKNGL